MKSRLVRIAEPSRRSFLGACAGCAAWLAGGCAGAAAAAACELLPKEKARVRLVFVHPDPKLEGWPYQGYDYESRKKMILGRLERGCPEVEFAPVSLAGWKRPRRCSPPTRGRESTAMPCISSGFRPTLPAPSR